MGLHLRSRDQSRLDTALQAVIPIGTFGAALAFSTLYNAERAGADARTLHYLSWAFALYLCSAILSMNTRLGVNIDPHNQVGVLGSQMRQFAFILGVLASLVATMLMTVSLTSASHGRGVRAAGVVASVVVGYAGLLTMEHAALYVLRDDSHRRHLALLHLLRSEPKEPSYPPFQPPKAIRLEIERFLHLHARYGKALAHLNRQTQVVGVARQGATSSGKTPFEYLPLDERTVRLAYAAMAFNRTVRFEGDNSVSRKLLRETEEFLAEPMRKWDDIIDVLARQDGGEDNWWQTSRPCQVLRMWWLHEANGGEVADRTPAAYGLGPYMTSDVEIETGRKGAEMSEKSSATSIRRPMTVSRELPSPPDATDDLAVQAQVPVLHHLLS